jgi:hypothetical protein
VADNPMTTSGTGGAAPLPKDPMFSDTPPGAVTDAEYLAEQADLRQQINSQYQEILGQLGYTDPVSGAFIPGSVEQKADIETGNLRQAEDQARLGVNRQVQNEGTTFSGIRGSRIAEAEQPYVSQIGGLNFDTTNTLADLYRQAQSLMGSYTTQNMKLLQAAADRAAAKVTANPVDAAAAASDGTDPDTTPPPPPPVSGVPGDIDLKGNPPPVQSGVGGIIRPPTAFAKGGEITRPTRATLGEHARPGDLRSHEVVIPREKLSTEGNAMLDHLMHAAGIRQAALQRLHPSLLNAPELRGIGRDEAAAQLWMHRHPYAIAHGGMPPWVSHELTGAIHSAMGGAPVAPEEVVTGIPHGFGPGGAVTGVPPAGIGQLVHPIHHLAHAIGLAALHRIHGLPPMPPATESLGEAMSQFHPPVPVVDPGDGWLGAVPPPQPVLAPPPEGAYS